MPDSENGPETRMSRSVWLLLAVVVLSLGTFVATYLPYFTRHETGASGSYSPLAIGIGSYFVLMCALNFIGFSPAPTPSRLAKAAAIALVEVFVFVFLLMILLLNTLGS